jgi:hypothetical protein
MEFSRAQNRLVLVLTGSLFLASAGCLGVTSGNGGGSTTPSCPNITGSPWVPNVPGVSASNHDSSVQVSQQVLTSLAAPIAGEGDPITGNEVTVHFTVSQDLGLNGAVSLIAQASNVAPVLTSPINPLPFLTYLSDGTNEYINLTRGNNGASCDSGIMTCDSGGNCNPNPNCAVGYPSAYGDFYHYLLHQTPSFGLDTVNTFPTCRWTEGTTSAGAVYTSTSPACGFNTYLASTQGHLPVGSYTAKYVLVSDNYASVSGSADLKVTVVEKADANTQPGGALDFNVILVGSKNIQDSHTPAGQRNLNTLFKSVSDYLGTPNVNISIGKINVYEVGCESNGDNLAMMSSDNMGSLLSSGSGLVNQESQGKALNVFLISQFGGPQDAGILGMSGAIGGPAINGLQTSGLTFATFNNLATFNSSCTTSPCPLTSQDADFYEMGNTIAHESGHYLGLNHPSESGGTIHDNVYDTPVCTAVSGTSGGITIGSCLNNDTNIFAPTGQTCHQTCTGYNSATGTFCPEARECGFNYMMWWSSKHFYPGTGAADGNLYSPDSGLIMNMNPFVQ